MTKELKTTSFDYEGLDKDLKGKLVALAGQIRRSTKSHLEHALDMGQAIEEALELLAKAGKEIIFSDWVKRECGFSVRTAYNYVNAYSRFGGSRASLAQFTAEAIYLLSDDKITSETVDTAINLANKGTRITKDVAEELKRKYQPDERPDDPEPEDMADGEDSSTGVADSGGSSSHEEEADGAEEAPAAAKLFAEAEKHYAALTQLLDQLNKLVPHHSKADAQESLNLSYLDFRAWRRKTDTEKR